MWRDESHLFYLLSINTCTAAGINLQNAQVYKQKKTHYVRNMHSSNLTKA